MKTVAIDGRLLACFFDIRNGVCQRFFALVIIEELIFEVLQKNSLTLNNFCFVIYF